jgi:hypothetical protein
MIGALLILANSRPLRNIKIFIIAVLLAAGLAAAGLYFLRTIPKETDGTLLFPMFTPLSALILMQVTRWIYRMRYKKEIILHMYGLFPVRHDERYVTGQEKFITFIVLLLSVVIPYLALTFFR